jgi:hypothetical protein
MEETIMSVNKSFRKQITIACLLALTAITAYSQIVVDCTSNPIKVENCLTGTRDWEITNNTNGNQASGNHEIEGYAHKTSVNAGQRIRFHIRSNPMQIVDFQIYRLGYYGGMGARFITSSHVVNVVAKPLPVPSNQTGLAEANWISETTSFWDVPSTAVSGFYVVKLTGRGNKYQSYIPFVVRKDSYASPVLFKIGVNTHQAYNQWPGWVNCLQYFPTPTQPCDTPSITNPENGKSLYGGDLSGGPPLPGSAGTLQARKVSFNRPYGVVSSFGIYDTLGGGFANYEYPMIRWLEKEGYDVTYVTDTDIENDPQPPTNSLNVFYPGKHKVLLSVGHDEYWSWKMRDNVEKARNHVTTPLNIAFFSGNSVYWQVRYEPSSTSGTFPSGASSRTMVCYKETARLGAPLARDTFFTDTNPANDFDITDFWRNNFGSTLIPAKPPEDELVGVMSIPPEGDATHPATTANGMNPIYCCSSNKLELASTAPMWLTNNIGNNKLHNLIGYESDELYRGVSDPYPNHNPTIIVGSSSFIADRGPLGSINLGTAETTFYTMQDTLLSNGAKVFAASGQQWAWGLDDWGADGTIGPVIKLRLASENESAKKMTKNIIDCFLTNASCGN